MKLNIFLSIAILLTFIQCQSVRELKYPTGDVYFGEMDINKPNGKGLMKYVNGDVYDGDFKEGVKNGQGKYTFKTGDVYTGKFENERFSGKGKIEYKSGDIYEGDFKEGKFHGKGKYSSITKGFTYEGDFIEDKRNGQGIETRNDGKKYYVEYLNDKEIKKTEIPLSSDAKVKEINDAQIK